MVKKTKFIYKSYDFIKKINSIELSFKYILKEEKEEITFNHLLSINTDKNINIDNIENIIFNIGLIEAINYWKLSIPKDFIIECGSITKEQQNWFKKLYYKGLGEFLYINNIKVNIDNFIIFHIQSNKEFVKIKCDVKNTPIIPIGGGKDSLVTYNLFKNELSDMFLLGVNPIEASKKILNLDINKSIFIKRVLDPKLSDFNKNGYLNGHVPFSSILGFIFIFVGLIYKCRYIVLSNESSAEESNTIFNKLEINHQYSKSLEFENDFRFYIKKYVTDDVEYFSFLRPLDEITIAKTFAKFSDFFQIFRSCNVGSKKNIWCSKCSKCLFTYIILCNFISDKNLDKIFNKKLFEDKELLNIFIQLFNKNQVKPFDCVGSYDEVNYMIQKKIDNYLVNNIKLPFLLDFYNKNTPHQIDYDFQIILDKNSNIPNKFINILKKI